MLWRNTLSRVILSHLSWGYTALCNDELLQHFGKMGLLDIKNTAQVLMHAARPVPTVWGWGSSVLCVESDCRHQMLRNNRIIGPEVDLELWLPLHFADEATWFHELQLTCGGVYKQRHSILCPDSTPPCCLLLCFLSLWLVIWVCSLFNRISIIMRP